MFLVCSISWDSVQLFCPYQILLIEKKNRNNNNNSKGISLYTIKLQRGWGGRKQLLPQKLKQNKTNKQTNKQKNHRASI